MGRHVLRGEFPIFYDGQKHMGGLEPHLAALGFASVGATPLVLKLVCLAVALETALAFLQSRRIPVVATTYWIGPRDLSPGRYPRRIRVGTLEGSAQPFAPGQRAVAPGAAGSP